MQKIDYKKQLPHLYNPSAKKAEIVNIPIKMENSDPSADELKSG